MNCPLQLWDEFLPQVELTLNLLRFSRRNPLISANNELYGPFDFGKTPLAPLGTKALIYDDPAVHASWAPHAIDGYYVGPATDHYRCLRFYIPTTHHFRFAATWRLYPTHCQVPVLSEHDKTLLTANDFLQRIGATIPTSAQDKIKHLDTIRRLSEIMSGQPDPLSPAPPTPRVGNAAPPRVATDAPPRVATDAPPRVAIVAPLRVTPPSAPRVATTSNTITAPTTLRRLPRTHQRVTRANNPFEVLADDDVDDDTVIHSNRSPNRTIVPAPVLQPVTPPVTVSPPIRTTSPSRTHRPHAVLPLPPVQQRRATTIPSNRPTTLVGRSIPIIVPTSTQRVDAHPTLYGPGPMIIPTTTRQQQHKRVPSANLHTHFIVPHVDIPSPHDLRPVTFKHPRLSTYSPLTATNVIEPNDDRTNAPTLRSITPPRRSTRLIAPRRPGNVSIQAINHVIRLEANKFTNNIQWTGPLIDIEEHCFGVVHPITKETITQYKKLQHDPDLKELWVPAMSKELHRLAQGKAGITKGTNTIFYMTHNEIRVIPTDRTVTYARIVIDHRPQKEDPNRVRITVGGNLINYPFELTTRTTDMVSSKILWNSTISTKGAQFAGADINNMYLSRLPWTNTNTCECPFPSFPWI
jgi:hypothetical protein